MNTFEGNEIVFVREIEGLVWIYYCDNLEIIIADNRGSIEMKMWIDEDLQYVCNNEGYSEGDEYYKHLGEYFINLYSGGPEA